MKNWHVFVDESGDHCLDRVDPEFPVFVLAAVLVESEAYVGTVVPALAKLKAEHWGHEGVVLHSSDIRRRVGPFAQLNSVAVRERFLGQLEGLMHALPFALFVSVLDKRSLAVPLPPGMGNPYGLALTSCIRQIVASGVLQPGDCLRLIAESRGAQEDGDLRAAFESLPQDATSAIVRSGGGLRFAAKRLNVAGLQLADLCARPFGRRVIDSTMPNRTFDLLHEKIRRDGGWFGIFGK